jgi:NADH-quinone oxidoreductase subunit I
MAVDERDRAGQEVGAGGGVVREEPARTRSKVPGVGLMKGLGVTLKHMLQPSITQEYPKERPDLPPRTRGVIALKQENCTVCYLCSRECPDWCIYIDAHKETHPPAGGGKARSAKVLDRFAIDYALCMYCGICVEVCPFDALFWSPEFEYAEYDIMELTHEKDRLEEWTYKVLPPLPLEVGAEPPSAAEAPAEVSAAAPPPAPTPAAAPAASPAAAPPPAAQAPPAAPAEAPSREATAPTAPAPPAGERHEVEPDQETYDRVLAEEVARGTDRRVAEGRAKAAAVRAARKKAEG